MVYLYLKIFGYYKQPQINHFIIFRHLSHIKWKLVCIHSIYLYNFLELVWLTLSSIEQSVTSQRNHKEILFTLLLAVVYLLDLLFILNLTGLNLTFRAFVCAMCSYLSFHSWHWPWKEIWNIRKTRYLMFYLSERTEKYSIHLDSSVILPSGH